MNSGSSMMGLRYMLILIVFLSFGCFNEAPNDTNEIFFLEDEFNINLMEKLGPERRLALKVESIDEKSCLNVSVNYSYTFFVESKLHRIALKGIEQPEECDEGKAFAQSYIGLGNLEQGSYRLNIFLLDEIKNDGILLVEDDHYEILMETAKGIRIPFTHLDRIPDETIWGYLSFKDESLNVVVEDFLKDLDTVADPFNFDSGQYGYFQIDEDQKLRMAFEAKWQNHKTFLHKFSGETERLENLIDTFCEQFGETLEIKLWTSNGDILSCEQ